MLISNQGVRPGSINMGRILRSLRHHSDMSRKVVYHRLPIFKKDDYGVETGETETAELLLPNLPALIRPALTADYTLERGGANIIGAARVYTPNLQTIKGFDNFDQTKNPNFNEDLSLELARDDYYNNLKKESEIDLYGTEYWDRENLEYPEGTPYDTLADKQKAIKEDLTTPKAGESLEQFKERGGIVGAVAAKGITWNAETKSWNKPEFNDEEIIKQMIDKGQITE